MKRTKLVVIATVCLFVAVGAVAAEVKAQSRRQMSPEQVVRDLYRQHKVRSPFFQRKNRALVDRYFEKKLADLIWKDAKSAGDEVGALDGDPLFNAQDMEIKKFVIHAADYSASNGPPGEEPPPRTRATVTVSFENFRQEHKVLFDMSRSQVGWRIWDIRYDDGAKLSKILSGEQQ
jgi:uncharacterized protein DUF3828